MSHDHRAAVIGLGPMGRPIASRLIAAGHVVDVFNRSDAPAEALVAEGAQRVSMAEISSPVVLSVLPDADHLRRLLSDAVLASWRGSVRTLVVLSTTSPQKVVALGELLAPVGIDVLDAPMSGGDRGAQRGTLSLMVGGSTQVLTRVRPVLEAFSGRITHFGALGAGSFAKLCNQLVVGANLAALTEAMRLAEQRGLDVARLVEALSGGLAGSAVLDLKGPKILARDYSLGGSAANQLKDLKYLAEAVERSGGDAPVLALVRALFAEVIASGRGDEDHSVVGELFRR